MRVDVKKYLFIGPWKNRDAFFEKMQELGSVEFISSYEKRPGEYSDEVQSFIDALRILRSMVPVEERDNQDLRSSIVIAKHIIEKNQELEKCREEARILEKEIARVEVFGDFSVSELHKLEEESHRKFQFFYTRKADEIEAVKRPEVIYIGSSFGMDYFVAINKEPMSYEGMVEMYIDRSYGELRDQLAKANRQIDRLETDIGRMAHHKTLLQEGLVNALNYHHLQVSKEYVLPILDGDIFAVQGWIPKNKVQQIFQTAEEFSIHCEVVATDAEDRVPTKLENKGAARIGEDLVHIYDTPSIFDRDPSLWVFFAFALFFSMILGDGGYGIILLGISLFLYYKFNKKQGVGKRLIRLGFVLSVACIVWGLLFTSFFGIDISPDNPIRKYSVLNWLINSKAEYHIAQNDDVYKQWLEKYPALKNITDPAQFAMFASEKDGKKEYPIFKEFTDNVMIELSIFIGAIHLIISLLRYLDKHWAGIGWVLFIIGGYLYFPSILHATSLIHYALHIPKEIGTQIGLYLIFIGPILAAILAVIQKRLGGIGELMNVIQVFADAMSYLRIYALGLAGGIMASTFNDMGSALPVAVGIIIIIAGHIINLTLGIMGGVIHGLRLNFIEWYHYSFEGGGRQFEPLKLLKLKDE